MKYFLEAVFSAETRRYFSDLIDRIIPSEYLYTSPVATHIRGKMTHALHLTLYFGLTEQESKSKKLKKHIESMKLEKLTLGKIFFINGYQDLYKVMCIEVLDDGSLTNLLKEVGAEAKDKTFLEREFKPHLTLAYVTNEYNLPEDLGMIVSTIPVDRLQITSVEAFNQLVNNPASAL